MNIQKIIPNTSGIILPWHYRPPLHLHFSVYGRTPISRADIFAGDVLAATGLAWFFFALRMFDEDPFICADSD